MRRAIFIHVTTVALGLCLVLSSLLFTGFTQGERMARTALEYLGTPYVLGQRGPKKFDCSGLILFCAEREGLTDLPHAARELYELGTFVPRWALLPGDMVCFDTEDDRDMCDHVGIYLGGNRFVHASSAKAQVTISEIKDYYDKAYSGARRLVSPYF